jgi:geranylgeranyl diphosphate synthase type II
LLLWYYYNLLILIILKSTTAFSFFVRQQNAEGYATLCKPACGKRFYLFCGRRHHNTGEATMTHSHEDDVKMLLSAFEQRLEQLLPAGEQEGQVYAAMRDATLVAGKRMRPLLLLLAARDMGYKTEPTGILDLACAIEMVHVASLILDDMPCMDNATLRRERPTVHYQYGEHVAILAAVALLSHAFCVISRTPSLTHEAKARAIAELSASVGHMGLVQGQFRDLNEARQNRNTDEILLTNELKTSSLFNATLQLAAIAADAPPPVSERLRFFARDLGQAFQLIDDLTDGSSANGKDPHQDKDKSTLVAVLGAESVFLRLREHVRSADQHIATACQPGNTARYYVHIWFEKQLTLISQSLSLSLSECQ